VASQPAGDNLINPLARLLFDKRAAAGGRRGHLGPTGHGDVDPEVEAQLTPGAAMRWQCRESARMYRTATTTAVSQAFVELVPYRSKSDDDDSRELDRGAGATAVRWDRSRCWQLRRQTSDPRNTECLVCIGH